MGENGRPRRVLVVDDHPVVRAGIVQFLSKAEGLVVCGEAGTIAEARTAVAELEPDLVLLDLLLRKVISLELIKELIDRHPGLRILVLSMMDEAVYATRCLRAGARGFIMKEEAPDELVGAIGAVIRGEAYVSRRVAQDLIAGAGRRDGRRAPGRDGGGDLGQLTDRELQVFQMVGEGMRPREIAALLSISRKTVDAHKEHIKNKLGVATSAELARRAAQWHAEHRG